MSFLFQVILIFSLLHGASCCYVFKTVTLNRSLEIPCEISAHEYVEWSIHLSSPDNGSFLMQTRLATMAMATPPTEQFNISRRSEGRVLFSDSASIVFELQNINIAPVVVIIHIQTDTLEGKDRQLSDKVRALSPDDVALALFANEVYQHPTFLLDSYVWPGGSLCYTWTKLAEGTGAARQARWAIFKADISGTSRVILAFKGTDSVTDAITDISVVPVSCFLNGQSCGSVHKGFYNAYVEVKAAIRSQLTNIEGTWELHITGHSLGGALAVLAALDFGINRPAGASSIHLVTIGQPAVGDSDFAAAFPLLSSYNRYRNMDTAGNRDLVTLIPPNFEHINAATDLIGTECDSPLGVSLEFCLHSAEIYVARLKAYYSITLACANNCAGQASDDLVYSSVALPSSYGCAVLVGTTLDLSISSLSGDTFAICVVDAAAQPPYQYSNAIDCGGTFQVLRPRGTAAYAPGTLTFTVTGSFSIVIENHNNILPAHLTYSYRFNSSYIVPSAPQNLRVTYVTDTTFGIAWSAPEVLGNPTLTSYRIQLYGENIPPTTYNNIATSPLSLAFTNATDNTAYIIGISAQNSFEGAISNWVAFVTGILPLAVQITSIAPSSYPAGSGLSLALSGATDGQRVFFTKAANCVGATGSKLSISNAIVHIPAPGLAEGTYNLCLANPGARYDVQFVIQTSVSFISTTYPTSTTDNPTASTAPKHSHFLAVLINMI